MSFTAEVGVGVHCKEGPSAKRFVGCVAKGREAVKDEARTHQQDSQASDI